MDPFEPQRDHSAIFQTFAEYKRRLQQGEESAAVGNGSYLLKDSVLYKKIRNHWGDETEVEVPITQDIAREAVKKVHHKLGHLGIKAMLAALRTRVNIPYVREIAEHTIRTCNQCQFTQREPTPMQPLHPIPRVDAGDAWAFDFIGPLPKTAKGNQYLLTAMDLGTDWAIAQALPRRSSESVAKMLRYIIFTYGKPMAILTDNGEEFLSYHVQNLLRRFGIHHSHTTPYHPQTNGRLEKFNDVLTQMLVRMTAPTQQERWDEYLPDALLAHRVHTSSSMAKCFNEIQQIKKLCTSENGDWSTYKIWLASGRKRTAGQHNALKRKHPNRRGDIENEGLVLEIW
jgi:transposase InsO family protein